MSILCYEKTNLKILDEKQKGDLEFTNATDLHLNDGMS